MAKFKIDEKEYDTDDLDNRQKRIVDLYQRALRDEAEAIAAVELKRAARRLQIPRRWAILPQ